MKANDVEVLRIPTVESYEMQHPDLKSRCQVIQLKSLDSTRVEHSTPNGNKPAFVTIRFNVDSDWETKQYNQFFAERRAIESRDVQEVTEKVKPSRKEELDELHYRRNQERGNTLHGKTTVLRYTPEHLQPPCASNPRNESSEGNTSRSASTSRSNPPAQFADASRSNPPAQFAGPSTRRRSARNAPSEKAAQATDQDEVILVYPQGVPGAVNVTNGDLARLEPGEYLNDTLIEFGLKLWLRELEAENPELAKQIHVFNSFFYKKLNHKKGRVLEFACIHLLTLEYLSDEQAFESVRKWTSKFDIFQKKYIIVPINEHLHWYLAVIYEPEHVLSSTASEGPSPRKHTRLSAKIAASKEKRSPTIEETPLAAGDGENSVSVSEAEVERDLNTDFQSSCNIDIPVDEPPHEETINADDDAKSDLSYLTDPHEAVSRPNVSPTASNNDQAPSIDKPKHRSLSSNEMVVDDSEEEVKLLDKGISPVPVDSNGSSDLRSSKANPRKISTFAPVDPHSFYQSSAKAKGKRKAETAHVSVEMDVDQDRKNEVIILDESPKTYIFTFDSLGTRHPQAIRRLGNYLVKEARDKKGVQNAALAEGKMALQVPVQPNFCDCGVYLLHFAQTFMSNPQHYFHVITAPKSKSTNNKERQEEWEDHKVAGMREELATRILQLSAEWKKDRAAKEGVKNQEGLDGDKINVIESSDSDIDIVMPSPAKKNRANRMRG
ncbi:hypothetical protein BDZ97DRAFT_919789 [Flammula alnicola]|nr:hypothetical protein BDZ97DRAFT_919789 [Flammula alnicola]